MGVRIMAELKRRGVLHAAGIYAAVAFVALQVADLVLPALALHEAAYRVVVFLILAGFPLVLVLSWFFDLTPGGMRRTADGAVPAPARKHRFQLLSVIVIAVLVMAAGGLAGVRASLDEPRSDDGRIGIAIFPFRAATAEWAEGLPDLLATAIDGTEGYRVIDPWGLWAPLRASPEAVAASPDPARAAELARKADARRIVLGALVASGDDLEINIRIYDPRFARPLETFSFTASRDELAGAVQRLAVEIITRVWDRDALPGIHRLEPNVTRSPGALKAYLAARMAMRRGQVDSAVAAIDHALALDSTFALGLAEATIIRSWWSSMRGQPYSGLFGLLERAAVHDDSLSERHRLRIQALTASVRTDGKAAADALRRVIEIDSTDIGAWSFLASVHQVYGWQYGATAAMTTAAAERVIQLDSAYVPGIAVRAWLRADTGDSLDASIDLARLLRVDTTTQLARSTLRAIRLLTADDAAAPGLIEAVAAAPPVEWIAPIRYLRAYRPARVDRLLDGLRETAAAPALRGEWARLRLASGDAAAVDSVLTAGTFTAPGTDWQVRRMLVAAALAGVGDTAIARRAAHRLAEYTTLGNALALFQQRDVWLDAWLLGAWHAQFGDPGTARRWRELIGRFPEGGSPSTWREGMQADIDARLAVREHRIDVALDRARAAREAWYIHADVDGEWNPAPAIRFHLALLERETGGTAAAEALFRSLVPPTTWSGFYTARASFELGEIAAVRGDKETARRRYSAALQLFELNPDPSNAWRQRSSTALAAVVGRLER